VEESVQIKNPSSIFSGASFWDYPGNLWHLWTPVLFDKTVNGWPTVFMGHHVKEENR
jgi:hypothetical protein